MDKIIILILAIVFFAAAPVLGCFSYAFYKEGNWICTYLCSGLSMLAPVPGFLVLKDAKEL